MVIYGTRGVTSTMDRGDFFCPRCGDTAPYQHQQVRRYFTLYFIPIIPLDRLGEYVECGSCAGTYKPEVLQLDPRADRKAFEAEFQIAVRRVMLKMMVADGNIADEEVASVAVIYERLTKQSLSEAQIRDEAEALRADPQSVLDIVRGVRGSLNANGKEVVVRAALAIAAADGDFHDDEKAMVMEIGQALELTRAHLLGILRDGVESDA